MRIIMIACAMSFGIGCATSSYYKKGGTQQEFMKAKTDCQVKMNQAGLNDGPAGFGKGMAQGRFLQECMAGEGWTKQ